MSLKIESIKAEGKWYENIIPFLEPGVSESTRNYATCLVLLGEIGLSKEHACKLLIPRIDFDKEHHD